MSDPTWRLPWKPPVRMTSPAASMATELAASSWGPPKLLLHMQLPFASSRATNMSFSPALVIGPAPKSIVSRNTPTRAMLPSLWAATAREAPRPSPRRAQIASPFAVGGPPADPPPVPGAPPLPPAPDAPLAVLVLAASTGEALSLPHPMSRARITAGLQRKPDGMRNLRKITAHPRGFCWIGLHAASASSRCEPPIRRMRRSGYANVTLEWTAFARSLQRYEPYISHLSSL